GTEAGGPVPRGIVRTAGHVLGDGASAHRRGSGGIGNRWPAGGHVARFDPSPGASGRTPPRVLSAQVASRRPLVEIGPRDSPGGDGPATAPGPRPRGGIAERLGAGTVGDLLGR